jgi:tetratricopeptide (TPR) repeat protein
MVRDRAANRASYLRGLELARAAGDVLLESRILANLGSALTEEGDFEEAVTRLQDGLVLAEELGGPWRVAMMRLNLAGALTGLGRLDEALVEIDLARLLWSATGSAWEAAAWSSRGAVQAARGNLAEAITALRTATAIAGAEDDHQTLVPALAGLARVVAAEDPADATALVHRLLTLPVALGRVEVRLAAGWVALHAGRADEAARHGDAAHAEALERRDRAGRGDALLLTALATHDAAPAGAAVVLWDELGSPLQRTVAELVHAHLAGDPLGRLTARDELRQLGVHDDAWRAAGPLHAVRRALPDVPVVIHTLGSFVVYRDGVAAGVGDWPSTGSPALLRALVVAGSATATPDVVEELRSVLDPAGAYPADQFVAYDGSTARLRPDRVRLDVADFLQSARVALEGVAANRPDAPRMLRSAASLYTGDFLEEATGDAAAALREEVAGLGHEVNRALADLLATGSTPTDAVPWLARILASQPEDERAYADLVRVLSGAGDHAAARRHYDAYVWHCRLGDVRPKSQEELLAPVAR